MDPCLWLGWDFWHRNPDICMCSQNTHSVSPCGCSQLLMYCTSSIPFEVFVCFICVLQLWRLHFRYFIPSSATDRKLIVLILILKLSANRWTSKCQDLWKYVKLHILGSTRQLLVMVNKLII